MYSHTECPRLWSILYNDNSLNNLKTKTCYVKVKAITRWSFQVCWGIIVRLVEWNWSIQCVIESHYTWILDIKSNFRFFFSPQYKRWKEEGMNQPFLHHLRELSIFYLTQFSSYIVTLSQLFLLQFALMTFKLITSFINTISLGHNLNNIFDIIQWYFVKLLIT